MMKRCAPIIAGLVGVVACGTDSVTASATTEPARALPMAAIVDTTVVARLLMPFVTVVDGQVPFDVVVTSRRSDTLTSGKCVSFIDARALGTDTWYDVTPATITCTDQLMTFTPGRDVTLSGRADQAKLRVVAGRPRTAVFLRARAVLATASGGVVGVQSAELPLTAP